MKFGKLLAAGKSWAGGPGSGRYQMREGLQLPKFISPKNPFKPEAAASPAPSATVAVAPATIMTPQPAPVAPQALMTPPTSLRAKMARINWKNRAQQAGRTAGRLSVKLAQGTGAGLQRAALFCMDHNPFSAIGRPKLPGIPRFGKPAVQGELSLDRVKVVRNDLTHADLEVVPAGGGPK